MQIYILRSIISGAYERQSREGVFKYGSKLLHRSYTVLLTPLRRALCTPGIIIILYYLRAGHPWGEHKEYELMYEKRMCGTEQGRIQDFYEGK
jgi:hypothetical protein